MVGHFQVALVRFPEDLYSDPLDVEEEVMLVYFAGAAKARGFNIRVLDFHSHQEYELPEIMKDAPDLIAVCVRLPGTNMTNSVRQIREFRQMYSNRAPHITLIGHTGTVWKGFTPDSPFDSILFGEESEFVNLLDVFSKNQDPSTVTGLAYKTDKGAIAFNDLPQFGLTVNIDASYHYYLDYLKRNGKRTNFERAAIQTSRGCYAGCEFCFIQAYKKIMPKLSWRPRPDEEIFNEIEELITNYGITNFKFFDMEFVGPGHKGRARAIRLAQGIIKRGLHISFLAYIRADHIDEELLLKLKEAGLTTVFLGVESFSQNMLKRFNKGVNASTNLQALNLCIKHEIFVHMGLIPFDSKTVMPEVLENLEMLRDVVSQKPWLFSPTQFIYNPITPIPHTPSTSASIQNGVCVLSESHQGAFADERVSLMANIYSALAKDASEKQLQVRNYLESRIADESGEFDGAQFYSILNWFSGLSIIITNLLYESAQTISKSSNPNEMARRAIARNHELLTNYDVLAEQILQGRNNNVHSS